MGQQELAEELAHARAHNNKESEMKASDNLRGRTDSWKNPPALIVRMVALGMLTYDEAAQMLRRCASTRRRWVDVEADIFAELEALEGSELEFPDMAKVIGEVVEMAKEQSTAPEQDHSLKVAESALTAASRHLTYCLLAVSNLRADRRADLVNDALLHASRLQERAERVNYHLKRVKKLMRLREPHF